MNNEYGSASSTSGTSTVKETVQKLADQGGETIGVIKGRASEMADQLKQQYSNAMHRAVDFVQERPLSAVGLAVGLGYFSRTLFRIGMLASVSYVAMNLLGRKMAAEGGEAQGVSGQGQGVEADIITTTSY